MLAPSALTFMKIAVFLKFDTVCPPFFVYCMKVVVAGFCVKLATSRQTAVSPVACFKTSNLNDKLDNFGMTHFYLGLTPLLHCVFPCTFPDI